MSLQSGSRGAALIETLLFFMYLYLCEIVLVGLFFWAVYFKLKKKLKLISPFYLHVSKKIM